MKYLKTDKITKIEYIGKRRCYDLHVEDNHNFFTNWGILTHNTGGGKSISKNTVAAEFKRCGYIWICYTDEKDNFELAYQMFPPEKDWHLKGLKYEGRPIKPEKVIIWHPFTFNLPSSTKLQKMYGFDKHPEMRVFTIPVTSLGREEISVLTETDADKTAVKLFFDAIRKVKKNEGISDMLYYAHKSIQRKQKQEGKKTINLPDPENFFLPAKMAGTAKTMSELIGYFKPYVYGDHYLLSSEDCPLNLNVQKDIFKKQRYTHVLVTKYIEDRKVKDFVILWFMKNILRNIDYCDYPLLHDFEEVRKFLPRSVDGWKKQIAKNIKGDLSILRSKGPKGNSMVMTTQVLNDVNTAARDSISPNEMFIGPLGNMNDIEKIQSALKLTTDDVRKITGAQRNTFLKFDKEYREQFRVPLPRFMHAEEDYDFVEKYHKYHGLKPDVYPLMDFEELRVQMTERRDVEFARMEKRSKEEVKEGAQKDDNEEMKYPAPPDYSKIGEKKNKPKFNNAYIQDEYFSGKSIKTLMHETGLGEEEIKKIVL